MVVRQRRRLLRSDQALYLSQLEKVELEFLIFFFGVVVFYLFAVVTVLLGETADSEDFCCLEKGRQRALMHVNLAVVDELDEGMQIGPGNILQDYHRVFTRSRL